MRVSTRLWHWIWFDEYFRDKENFLCNNNVDDDGSHHGHDYVYGDYGYDDDDVGNIGDVYDIRPHISSFIYRDLHFFCCICSINLSEFSDICAVLLDTGRWTCVMHARRKRCAQAATVVIYNPQWPARLQKVTRRVASFWSLADIIDHCDSFNPFG